MDENESDKFSLTSTFRSEKVSIQDLSPGFFIERAVNFYSWNKPHLLNHREYSMKFRLKVAVRFGGLILGLGVVAGSAMALDIGGILDKVKGDFAAINEKGEQDRARIRGDRQPTDIAKAGQSEPVESKPPKLVIPKDKKVASAMEEALPIVQKVLSIHQCIKEPESLRQLNVFAVPGLNMIERSGGAGGLPAYGFPNSQFFMKFHDRNKCVGVTVIDGWSMPALNALLFRTVFFAEDSGETVNFLYMFKRVDDGSWKLSQIEQTK